MITQQRKIQHLYWRAGFGPPLSLMEKRSLPGEINSILHDAERLNPLILENWDPALAKEFRLMTDADKSAYRKQERAARLQINSELMRRYASATNMLREKMTFFWMGHFACRIANPVFIVKYYNTIHEHALLNFGDLLKAMIRNSALLQYLNNNQNRKSSPNENFARELMELFTLGIGNYSEQDVKEGARALTGWGFDRFGEFVIRQEHHDKGIKNFLGETGTFNGDDLVRIILTKKECAHFITTRIYKFFVNDVPDPVMIKELSSGFFNSGYDLMALMEKIFSSEWFYGEQHIGSKIKSPHELLAGMIRNFNIKFENPLMPVQLQKVLGQVLFDPPNVAGWPGAKSWIDSSTLMYRMRLPELLLQDAESIIEPKEDFDAQETLKAGKNSTPKSKKVKTTFESGNFTRLFSDFKTNGLTTFLQNYLLQVDPGNEQLGLINNLTAGVKGPGQIFKTSIYMMSLPEYQLC